MAERGKNIGKDKKEVENIAWGEKMKKNPAEIKALMQKAEKEKLKQQELIEKFKISLWLDNYNDIFSDFDPRPFSQRALSDDFLNEAKKASKEKVSGQIELNLLIPEKERNLEQEKIVRKRLHEHFKRHFNLLKEEVWRIRRNGLILVLTGFSMMVGAAYLYSADSLRLAINFLFVLLEPGGWFITWYGLDKIFYDAGLKKPDLNFYEKMAKSEIGFLSY